MILVVPVRSCSDFPVAQMVNLPAMQETWVRSLGCEDPPEEGMVTHSSILAWSIPMDRGAWWATVRGVTKGWTRLSDNTARSCSLTSIGCNYEG